MTRSVGHPRDITKQARVLKYRLQEPPLSFSEIAKKMKTNKGNVHKMYKRALSQLSTVALDKV